MTNVIPLNTDMARQWAKTGQCYNGHDITDSKNVRLIKRANGTVGRQCRICANARDQRNRKPSTNPRVEPSTGKHYLDDQQLSRIAHKLTNARPTLTEPERDVVADVLRRVAEGLRRADTVSRHPMWHGRRDEGMAAALRKLLGLPMGGDAAR